VKKAFDIRAEWNAFHNEILKKHKFAIEVVVPDKVSDVVGPLLQQGFEILMDTIMEKLQSDDHIEEVSKLTLSKEEALAMGDKGIHELFKARDPRSEN
jgi:hypothetical protein